MPFTSAATRLRLPHASIAKPLLARGIVFWVLVRVVTFVVAATSLRIPLAELLTWSLAGSIAVLVTCALVGFIDTRRRGERALLGNLGIHDREFVLVILVPAATGELVLALVLP